MMAPWISQYTENPHIQTNIWTLNRTTITNTICSDEHSLTELTAWSLNRSRKMLRSEMSSPHSRPMATMSGPSRSSHPKTSPTPLITPQRARPAPTWVYHISEVHPKNWPEFKKKTWSRGLPQALQHPALHPCPRQGQDTWSQKVWCHIWNPVSGMPRAVCRWNCPYLGDKDERPPKTEVSTNSCGRPWTPYQKGRCQSDRPRGQYVATQDPWVHRNQDRPPGHQPRPGIWAPPLPPIYDELLSCDRRSGGQFTSED